MGSLVPGWDRAMPGCPPPEYADSNADDKEEQARRKGYFATLKLHQALRRSESLDEPSPHTPSHTPSSKAVRISSFSTATPTGLERIGSLPLSAGKRAGEPDARSACASLPSSLDAHRGRRDKANERWWRKFSSSALNELAEAEADKGHLGTFAPQYDVTGQGMHYRTQAAAADEAPPVIPAH